ncbi:MAG: hypothetical protein GQ564_23480 [Bacteroidales bacterium]|nr:hypothetical protein [Bacteroidales bacterium]
MKKFKKVLFNIVEIVNEFKLCLFRLLGMIGMEITKILSNLKVSSEEHSKSIKIPLLNSILKMIYGCTFVTLPLSVLLMYIVSKITAEQFDFNFTFELVWALVLFAIFFMITYGRTFESVIDDNWKMLILDFIELVFSNVLIVILIFGDFLKLDYISRIRIALYLFIIVLIGQNLWRFYGGMFFDKLINFWFNLGAIFWLLCFNLCLWKSDLGIIVGLLGFTIVTFLYAIKEIISDIKLEKQKKMLVANNKYR